jgi:hypothetical protein
MSGQISSLVQVANGTEFCKKKNKVRLSAKLAIKYIHRHVPYKGLPQTRGFAE